MKESYYNYFIKPDKDNPEGYVLAYNSVTCALATMDSDNYKQFLAGKENGFNELDSEFKKQLKRGNYIIDDQCNELLVLRHRLLAARYGMNGLGLTIAPTLGCNFDCIYCYENDHTDYTKMSEDIQNKIIELVKDKIKSGIKLLSITWYGGEPLLATDVIESLSEQFIGLCEEADIRYNAGIITNGYLLTRETINKLIKCHIETIQVTLDGPKDIHDNRRFLRGGYPTYDTIVKNLEDSIDIIPHVSLRVNVDKDNIDRVNEIKSYFDKKELKDKISVYVAMVDSNERYDQNNCLSMEKYVNMDMNFYDNPKHNYPSPLNTVCGADKISSIVIAPDGSLYKCWDDIGIKEMSFGNINNINNEETHYSAAYYEYIMYDPTSDEKCLSCKLLPICMGGCPHRRLKNSPARCSKYKVSFDKYLTKVAQYLIQQKRQK